MGEQQRLGVLQMSHARHGHTHGALGKASERGNEPAHGARRFTRGVLDEQAKIGGHQFVAAARRVQLETQRAQPFDQGQLDEMMNVLGRRGVNPSRFSRGTLGNGVERAQRLAQFRGGQNAHTLNGPRPGAVHRQLVWQEAPVERQRALKLVEQLVRGAVEAPAPELARAGGLCGRVHDTESRAVAVTGKAKRLMKPSASLGL